MTAAVVVLGLVTLGLLTVLFFRERAHDQALDRKDQRHREEIRELTTRIQHPTLIPRPNRAATQPAPVDHETYAQIGTLTAPPQNGDGDDGG